MKLAVAITVNDRPEYLEQVISSWHSVRGIDEVPVIFQVEPESPCLQLCRDAGFSNQYVLENPRKMGALGNPFMAMQTGFEAGVDFVILGEDDSIVTADILAYFTFAAHLFPQEQRALAVCSFQYRPHAESFYVFRRHYFASVVWGTWRNRWDVMGPSWSFGYDPAWDRALLDLATSEMYCIFPGVSRSQHIGKYNGTHMPPQDFEEMQAKRVHDGSEQRYRIMEGEH